jgi:hypothetical protein
LVTVLDSEAPVDARTRLDTTDDSDDDMDVSMDESSEMRYQPGLTSVSHSVRHITYTCDDQAHDKEKIYIDNTLTYDSITYYVYCVLSHQRIGLSYSRWRKLYFWKGGVIRHRRIDEI